MKRILAGAATAALALGGLVATAMPASAHTPKVQDDCDSLTVQLWSYQGAHVVVEIDGEVVRDEPFDHHFDESFELDKTRAHTWAVSVDAKDDDQWDADFAGQTKACDADVEPEDEVKTALYLYEKTYADQPAAWENSEDQELLDQRDGAQFWTEIPVEDLPAEVCGPGWAVQQDIVDVSGGFEIPSVIYKQKAVFNDRLIDWRHQELGSFVEVPECDTPTPVTLPAPSPVEQCDAEPSVTLPESDFATYTEEWNDSRSEVTVTATPAEGVQLAEDAATTWTFTFTGEACESEPVVVTPDLPTVVDLCGTENDDVRTPKDTDEVTYETTADGIVASAAEGFTFGDLPAEYTSVDATTALYTVSEATFTDEACELIPGDIGAVCDASSPYLVYEISLPEGVEADGENPLTVTFLNPDGEDHVTTDLPLEGRLLWPGASAEEPLQWPGWELLEDGTYAETDGNFAWTRDGVQVQFEVNPDYSTVVDYPPASEDCADPSSGGRDVAGQTVVDVPEDGDDTVRAQEVSSEDELALTGATVGIAAAVALLLVAGGVTLFVVRRRLQQS